MKPKVALCNFFDNIKQLKSFALENDFSGVDWSFNMEELPSSPLEETRWVEHLSVLNPLEVRYHCPFMKVDLGHEDSSNVLSAINLFQRVIRLVSKTNGRFLTLHVGLGHDTTRMLSWERTIANLRSLVQYGANRGVKVCLDTLRQIGCLWWVIEIREAEKLLWTKQIIDDYIEKAFPVNVADLLITNK